MENLEPIHCRAIAIPIGIGKLLEGEIHGLWCEFDG